MTSSKVPAAALLLLFAISGLAGLVYQSAWSHYLGLVVGHAAYAQALVLVLFMGGMALGSWLASRFSTGWRQLFLAYAAIEFVIGLAALVFHRVFVGFQALSQDTVLPALSNLPMAHAWQWLGGAALIFPQCVLLGMTFPILSAGYLRMAPNDAGKVLGGLYFSNSFGAACGALATAFVLLPALGMPGSMFTAGLLNVIVALGAWVLSKRMQAEDAEQPDAKPADRTVANDAVEGSSLPRILLCASLVTGLTSFVYEIGWVRLLSQALGTTFHAFELMLASFILGLALGAAWVRQRGRAIVGPLRVAGIAQVLMGLAACVSLVVFARSFEWVAFLMEGLSRSDAGYRLFSLGSATVAMLVMLPAAFFAGMTLPLFTMTLLARGGGEKRIGQIYSANTLGAIIGVLAMIHVLIPVIGLHGAMLLAAAMDVLLGLWLIRLAGPRRTTVPTLAVVSIVAILGCAWLGRPNPLAQASGVFRTGNARIAEGLGVRFFKDGKTATVAVTGNDAVVSISTNGKPDAAMVPHLAAAPTDDEATMVMLGSLSTIFHPSPGEVAVIGWGSGLSTHTLLGSPLPRRVDSIEIEPAMHEGARQFGARVARAYEDPRSKLHIDDARTYLSSGARTYDVIVSEPSNPWVSGVASLFTTEFYAFARHHLKPGGMLVQWIQTYELSDDLLAPMLAALLANFPDADVYASTSNDLVVVAYTGPRTAPHWERIAGGALQAEMKRVGLGSAAEFASRKIGDARAIATYVSLFTNQAHSDYYPIISLNAPRSRFRGDAADMLRVTVDRGLPVAEMLAGRRSVPTAEVSPVPSSRFATAQHLGATLARGLRGDAAPEPAVQGDATASLEMRALAAMSSGTMSDADFGTWSNLVVDVGQKTLSQLPVAELQGVWIDPAWIDGRMQPRQVQDVLAAYRALAMRDPAQMWVTAKAVLANDPTGRYRKLYQQMYLQGLLAAVVLGDPQRIADVERLQPPFRDPELKFLRAYLLAWVSREASRTTP